MFTARRTTEGVLTLRGRAAFVAKFLTPALSRKPAPTCAKRTARRMGGAKAIPIL